MAFMPVKQSSQIHSLLTIMEHDPEAEEFVLNAIQGDPEAEACTEPLATKWLRAHEVISVEISAKRDAEALPDAHPDAHLEKFEERNAFPEAEPEADPESAFGERNRKPTSRSVMPSSRHTMRSVMQYRDLISMKPFPATTPLETRYC